MIEEAAIVIENLGFAWSTWDMRLQDLNRKYQQAVEGTEECQRTIMLLNDQLAEERAKPWWKRIGKQG